MIFTLLRAILPRRTSPETDEPSAVGVRTMRSVTALDAPDLQSIHAAHGDFVWLSLQRLGVRRADLPDMHQEVFIIVHKKLHTFDGRVPIRSWLFGICRCKAAGYRRLAWFRREEPTDATHDWRDDAVDPEMALDMRKKRAAVHALLDKLDVDKRAVFVMFELEGLSCEVIASTMGVPVGTVYSRLHAARKEFEKAARKLVARWDGEAP